MRGNNRRNIKGFTLIELLIVIAIIAILAAVLLPNLLGARARAVDTSYTAYARNVYTLAQVDLTTDAAVADTNCTTAYNSLDGLSSAAAPAPAGGTNFTCAVDGTTGAVTSSWLGGVTNEFNAP